MIKLLLRSSFILLTSIGIATLNSVLLARLLGLEGRAEFYYLFLPLSICPQLCSFGYAKLSLMLASQHQKQNIRLYSLHTLMASLIFGLIWSGLFYYTLGKVLDIEFYLYLFLTVLACATFSVTVFLSGLNALDEKFVIADIVKFLTPSLNLIGLSIAYYLQVENAAWVFLLQIITRAVELALVLRLFNNLFRKQQYTIHTRLSESEKQYRKNSWYEQLNTLVFNNIDKVLIAFIATKSEVGLFAVAAALALNLQHATQNVISIFLAKFKSVTETEFIRATYKFISIYIVLGLIGLLLCVLLLPYLIPLLFGDEFSDAATIANYLFLRVFLDSASRISSQNFIIFGNLRPVLTSQYFYLTALSIGIITAQWYGDFLLFLQVSVFGALLNLLLINLFVSMHQRVKT
ncbi:membrane protein [Catenovulum agarivorans DS-2]|uniref:Membrane protein n=1 Tax=Catenovulum agarivorans DS-2 TaxID=1328313 RepID=W7Q9B9_9ALTE|nr:hypothetical protein [Catenovulum agarivorans]EWH09414.1 membrane protein [Catenovulum agarivorans DS-2]